MTLTEDFIFVNESIFLIMSEIKLKFVTIENIPSQTVDQIRKRYKKLIQLYEQIGFFTHSMLVDVDFNTFTEKLGKVEVNIASA